VSGPHGFAVRACRARLAQPARPSHPASHVRDDRDTPLFRSGTGEDIHLICVSEKEKYFSKCHLTRFRKIGRSGKSSIRGQGALAGIPSMIRKSVKRLSEKIEAASRRSGT
jgi:hypothetical protein